MKTSDASLIVRRIICYTLIMLFVNSVLLFYLLKANSAVESLFFAALFVFYAYFNVFPRTDKAPAKKLKVLIGGYELIFMSTLILVSGAFLHLYVYLAAEPKPADSLIFTNLVVGIALALLLFVNGFIRIFLASGQLGATLRLITILCWWIPIANIVLFYLCCKTAKLEYEFEFAKHTRNRLRKDEKVCATKYPILMVHGIFFRDWKLFGYWGRIPEALTENGAVVYNGNQQSSLSVEGSAAELKERILEILTETKSEKVNVIAHSKGGLDMRYAISCLGMGAHVASLTTVNTPHMGCNFAGKIIDKAPKKFLSVLAKDYDFIYGKLGDEMPDFFSGVSELTAEKCAELNKLMTDCGDVVYQSVGSKMYSSSSAVFPLNIGYRVISALDGDNDGLVATSSMVWGDYLGTLSPPKKRGISHCDMVDLTRKNIYGFDVCEYYVSLVKGLKERGL